MTYLEIANLALRALEAKPSMFATFQGEPLSITIQIHERPDMNYCKVLHLQCNHPILEGEVAHSVTISREMAESVDNLRRAVSQGLHEFRHRLERELISKCEEKGYPQEIVHQVAEMLHHEIEDAHRRMFEQTDMVRSDRSRGVAAPRVSRRDEYGRSPADAAIRTEQELDRLRMRHMEMQINPPVMAHRRRGLQSDDQGRIFFSRAQDPNDWGVARGEPKAKLFKKMGRQPLVKEVLPEVRLLTKEEQKAKVEALVGAV